MPRHEISAALSRRETPVFARGTILNIVSWLLLAIVICTLIARFAVKLSMRTSRRRLGLDDVFISLSALFSIGQTVAVSIEAMRVLGQHRDDITPDQTLIYQKAEYTACILHIANMGCARLSICILIHKILPGRIPHYTTVAFGTFTALWTVVGIFVTAFACHLPHPWSFVQNAHCINVVAFVNYVSVTNIISEVLLILIPLAVWNVGMSRSRTAGVGVVFAVRSTVIAALILHAHFFTLATKPDFSYNLWASALCQQITQNLAVICACVPYFHPFIIDLLARSQLPTVCEKPYSHTSSDTHSQDSHYCRPLVTWGLDRANSPFPQNIARPIFTPHPPSNVFNRLIPVPSRPPTAPEHVGVLPPLDWESDSSRSRSRGSRTSPTSEYVFNRHNVVSMSDETDLLEEGRGGFKAPLPSPRRPGKAFF
ncbi:hypothetical protein CC86DRAFT_43418 [Ophiobolus disseminans]|uniref:Rhodopsin domain-containing protein n=1 Tax=Ophiobolus disseminans TaxID=1469910 RepID=A0A6A6ZXP1_9PLEO|nr:hypothetical protein CC86DRAFT_43418 [Ophiobolus disseminans]